VGDHPLERHPGAGGDPRKHLYEVDRELSWMAAFAAMTERESAIMIENYSAA